MPSFPCTEEKLHLSNVQHEAAATALRAYPTHRSLALLLEVGVGKTLGSIAVAETFIEKHPADFHRIVVVTKKGLINTYKDDVRKCLGEVPEHYMFITHHHRQKVDVNWKRTILVIDEVHTLRNTKSMMFKRALEYAEMARFVLLLTATPVVNRVDDLYALSSLLRAPSSSVKITPKEFKSLTSNGSFDTRLANFRQLLPRFILVKRDSSLFPEKVVHPPIEVEMSEEQWKIIGPVERKQQEDIDSGLPTNVFSNVSRRLSNYTRLYGNEGVEENLSPKLQRLIRHVFSAQERNRLPIVVFSPWKEAGILPLLSALQIVGFSTACITGDKSPAERSAIQTAYNTGNIQILGITAAGGEGINLQRTREVHIIDGNWNSAIVEQVTGRAIRRGSHLDLPENQRNVHVYQWISTIPTPYRKQIPLSSEQRLMELTREKDKERQEIMRVLERLSVFTSRMD